MAKSPSNSEIPPGTVSAANPEAGGILQLSPEDELIVNQYAQQRGITQAEAVRQLLDYSNRRAEQEQAKPTVMERTLGVIDQAQKLGVASNDPNDVINSMGRGVVIKSLAKGLEGDGGGNKKFSIDDLKEMFYISTMGKMAGINDNSGGAVPNVVQELKAQNEKLMQEMKERDEKHERQIKDMEAKNEQARKEQEARQQAEKEKSEIDKRFERLEQSQKESFEKLMQELKGGGGVSQKTPSSELQDLKTQNEKLIQELRDSRKESDAKLLSYMEKQDAKMRELVLEKKIQDGEKNLAAVQATVMQEVKNLSDKVELVRSIPPTAVPQKDAVSELEEIGGKLQRIKTAMEPIFPHVTAPAATGSVLPPVPTTPLKNPDGSTDYIAAAERLGTIVVKGLEAINKEKPPKANIAGGAQPAQQPVQEKRMSPEEYVDYLLSLPSRTAEQEQWLLNYRAYLEKEYAKLVPAAQQQPARPVHPSSQPVQQVTGCSICGAPVYQDGLCGACWADVNVPKEELVQPVQPAPAESPVLTWEQAERQYAELLLKPTWTDEEATWANLYEKKKRELLAQQQAGAVPVKEYTPPAVVVQPVQPVQEPVPEEVQPAVEAQPAEVVQEVVEQPQEAQPGVQAEEQVATEQPAEQPQEEQPQEDAVARMKREEQERTERLKGIL